MYDFKPIFKSINRMSNLLFCRCTSFWKILNRGKTRDPKSRTKCLITISINFGNNYIISFGKCFSQFFISGCKSLAMTTPCKKKIKEKIGHHPEVKGGFIATYAYYHSCRICLLEFFIVFKPFKIWVWGYGRRERGINIVTVKIFF